MTLSCSRILFLRDGVSSEFTNCGEDHSVHNEVLSPLVTYRPPGTRGVTVQTRFELQPRVGVCGMFAHTRTPDDPSYSTMQ